MKQSLIGRLGGAAVVAACVVAGGGCGVDRPETVAVSGRVLFDGQPPPAAGIVNFKPLESAGDLPLRPGSGRFERDGNFDVTSFDGGRGLVPGRYRVSIACLAGEPAPEPGGWEKASYVPEGYEPPELVIEPETGEIRDLVYDVPPKPE